MGKKLVLILILAGAVLLPVSAATNLFSLGYAGDTYLADNISYHSGSFTYTFNGNGPIAFHSQLTNSLAFGLSNNGDFEIILDDLSSGGFAADIDFLLGIGGDLNFGQVGLILGAGVYNSLRVAVASNGPGFFNSLGLGADMNFYIHPGDSKFVISIGGTASWLPLLSSVTMGSDDVLFNYDFYPSRFKFLLTVGFGLHT